MASGGLGVRPSNIDALRLMCELENMLPDIRVAALRLCNAMPNAWCILPDVGLVEKHRLVTAVLPSWDLLSLHVDSH